MSSLIDKEFNEKLDQLLVASVSSGSEPVGLARVHIPERPQFNWTLALGLVSYMSLILGLMCFWAFRQSTTLAEPASPAQDLWMVLQDSITVGAENLSSTPFLLYAGAAVAGGYVLSANWLIRLYRHH